VASLPRDQTNCSKRFSTAVFTKQLSTSTTLIYSTPDPPPLSNYRPSVVVEAISAQVCVGQVEKAAKGFLKWCAAYRVARVRVRTPICLHMLVLQYGYQIGYLDTGIRPSQCGYRESLSAREVIAIYHGFPGDCASLAAPVHL
jgi:hypothetical protein